MMALAALCVAAHSLRAETVDAGAFSDHVTFTVNGSGTAALTDFPLLVRISEAELPGFVYSRADSGELAFADGDGNALSYEVDTWDESGESTVWVKVPSVPVGGTTVTMYWSLKAGKSAPANVPSDVWSPYAGVWHMTDTATAKNDSTDKSTAADEFESLVGAVASNTNGVPGGALGSSVNKVGPLLKIKASDAVNALTNGSFTVSFWAYLNDVSISERGTPVLFTRRGNNSQPGYGARFTKFTAGDVTTLRAYFGPQGIKDTYLDWTDTRVSVGKWQKHDISYTAGQILWYIDGAACQTNDVKIYAVNGSNTVAIGGWVNYGASTANTLNGAIDEFRMRSGLLNSDCIAAEIANVGQSGYLSADAASFLLPGAVVTNGATKVDYWLSNPSISASLGVGGLPMSLDIGALRGGGTVRIYRCVNKATSAETVFVGKDGFAGLRCRRGAPRVHRLAGAGRKLHRLGVLLRKGGRYNGA